MHKPIVCTLTVFERVSRGMSWRRLAANFATSITELPNGYALALHSDEPAISAASHLVELERRCCAWMTLNLERGATVSLTLTADSKEGKATIAHMLGLRARQQRRREC
jgi:hypothetical protein